ncbi:hypothetical protein PENARI_c100G09676 [Penicillium arizonense]|uniref:RNase III domain-containing protein n=1 Tax=Penicillium arizonense TaxID=1835702 RepID=A0A1F5L1D0_PENAI|nr:hypothetical protein PENARI_c100G09676 [Penicillium arizonense]OGE46847.1 hypothetical protein PENARI_c100G09676 [Penicillium arizonense]
MVIFMPLPSDEEIKAFEDSVLQRTYRFTNRALIREALQGSSLFNPGGNKVLALADDATLRQILVDQGRDRNKSPEEIQNVITKVASNNNLNDQGVALGLDPFIGKNPGQWGLVAGRNVMATTMEAIIGAVRYDSNKNGDDCERVMAALGLSWFE